MTTRHAPPVSSDPDLTVVARLAGEPARSRMLLALMGGQALTATELALEADVAPSTASSHLGKLHRAGLVELRRQGRHRYYRLGGSEVAELLERLGNFAAGPTGPQRVVTGPKDPEMRQARVCYDHLAGPLSVRIFDHLVGSGALKHHDDGSLGVSDRGEDFFAGLGLDVETLRRQRRVLCRPCLDWSERRDHLAGALASELLRWVFAKGWAERALDSRTVHFVRGGRLSLERALGLT